MFSKRFWTIFHLYAPKLQTLELDNANSLLQVVMGEGVAERKRGEHGSSVWYILDSPALLFGLAREVKTSLGLWLNQNQSWGKSKLLHSRINLILWRCKSSSRSWSVLSLSLFKVIVVEAALFKEPALCDDALCLVSSWKQSSTWKVKAKAVRQILYFKN